jgi:phosphohistidine phosphatase
MEIYLLRHGIAEDRAASGRDADRRLTDEGRDKLRRILERAHAADVVPTLILASPLRRALETAEIAAHALGYAGRIVRTPALTPESSPPQVWEAIRERRTELAVLLAGHEPLFSATAAYLLGSTQAMIHFRKGALVRIDADASAAAPRGVLEWMLTAKLA